jgi:alpha-N-arabinofuranosidase
MYGSGVDAKEKNQLFRQQATMRDAVASALSLHIFNRYCYAVEMANIAQLTNCLSSLFLTDGEKCIETPIYHVFDMFQSHQGAKAFRVECDDEDISASASHKDGKILLTFANLSYSEDKELSIDLADINADQATLTLLSSNDLHAYNNFQEPDRIKPTRFEISLSEGIVIPKGSVAAISIPFQGGAE